MLMKKASLAGAFFVSAIWLSGAQAFCPVPSGLTPVAVQRVVDGDTFYCAGGPKVRLVGIDSPERAQGPMYAGAGKALRVLLPRQRASACPNFARPRTTAAAPCRRALRCG